MSEFEDVLEDVGSFGPFQITVFLLVSLFETPAAWAMVLPLFTAGTPEWHCIVNDTIVTRSHQGNQSMPNASYSSIPSYTVSELDNNKSDVEESLSECELVLAGKCDRIEYVEHFTSIITEWELQCTDQYSYATTLLKILQMVGVLVGAFITGQLADILGRRKVFYVVYSLLLMTGFASAFSNTWQLYVAFRFLIGACIGGTMVINFVLPLEFVGRQWRTFCGCIGFWAIGVATLPLLAYVLPNWRHLAMASSAGGVLLLFTYWWVPESPRWLIQKDRFEEAEVIIKHIAKRNGKPVPDLTRLRTFAQREKEKTSDHRQYSYWDLFRTPLMSRTTMVVLYAWFVCGCVYYGTTFSVEHLSGNRYLNLFLSGIVEIPPLIFVVIVNNKMGRRVTLACLMSLAGLSCFAVLFVHISGKKEELSGLSTALAHIGKAGIAGAWAATQVSSAELFPTVVRNIGIACCSMSARIGAIIAPQIVSLGQLSMVIPYVVYGCLGILCAFLTILLPETLNQPLPDTLPAWSCPCLKGKGQGEEVKDTSRSRDDEGGTKLELCVNDEVKVRENTELLSERREEDKSLSDIPV